MAFGSLTADPAVLQRWGEVAEDLYWQRRPETLFEPGERGGRWFPGGLLNAAENCLDRHLPALARRVAFYWEGEPGDRRALTYGDLQREVGAFAESLAGLGVAPGDRIALHLGLLPETIVALLACARLGAVTTTLASALPADALADRLVDFKPDLLVTQDGAWRHGVILPLKARADEAIAVTPAIRHTVVVRRTGTDVAWYANDHWYHELLSEPMARPSAGAASEPFTSEHPLLVYYIPSRRGVPVGCVHATGAFLAFAAAVHAGVLTENPEDVVWAAGDIACLAAQSHGVWGPLVCGGTSMLYEGMIDTPTHARAWELIERYRVNTLFTTQPVLRKLHRWSDCHPHREQVASLRNVISGGEAKDAALHSWMESQLAPGANLTDAWGQAGTGGITWVESTPRGADPFPQPRLDIVDADGHSADVGVAGELVLRDPWPGTFVGLQNDDPAELARVWEHHRGVYATGDGAVRRADGALVFLGRIDPMVTVSARLLSLQEVQETILEHPFVRDARIVERMDHRSERSLAGCVVLSPGLRGFAALAHALRSHVHERLGGVAQPSMIAFVESFPERESEATLKQALTMLCAAARPDPLCIHVDEKELTATLDIVRRTHHSGFAAAGARRAAARTHTGHGGY